MISIIVKMAANKLEADEGEKIKRQQECENRLQEDEPEMELPKLPEEVLVMIMKRVINNPKANKKTARDLGNMELVCRDWQRAALSVYKDLCLKRRKERSHTAPIFTWQNFDTEIRPFPDKCKIFFKKLVNTCCAFLDRERILDAKVDKLDVLRGLEQLMAERQRQYDAMNSRLPAHQRGIYDMYYRRSHYAEDEDGGLFGSPDKNVKRGKRQPRQRDLMVCSVAADTIQVWDVNSRTRVSVFHSDQIDLDNVMGTSFCIASPPPPNSGMRQQRDYLIFGTDSAKLRVFDIETCQLLRTYQVPPFRDDNLRVTICDVKVFKGKLFTVDQEGTVTRWKVKSGGSFEAEEAQKPPDLLEFEATIVPPLAPETDQVHLIRSFNQQHFEYRNRWKHRILDVNEDLIVTTGNSGWLCVISRKNPRSVTFERVFNKIECVRLSPDATNDGNVIYCGLNCGVIQRVGMRTGEGLHQGFYVNASPQSCTLIKQFTEYSDTITSLDVSGDGQLVVAGDVNGEIHGYLTDVSVFGRGQRARVFTLANSHSYGEYVWSVHLDDARLFSGGSDGLLVVHDLWNGDDEDDEEKEKQESKDKSPPPPTDPALKIMPTTKGSKRLKLT